MFDNAPSLLRAEDIQKLGIMGINKAREFMRRKDLPIVHIGSRKYITKDNFIKVLNEGGEF